jgi:formiminotetrahydrofolate cyclodeaminase
MSDADSVWTWGLAAFRDRLASDAPTPGGGSAAMVSASLGAALVAMALRVTANRADADTAVGGLIAEADRLGAALARHADADIAVFDLYMAALRLPRGTDAEKAVRRKALEDAAIEATRVPLAAAGSVIEMLEVAARAAPLAARAVVSDVGAGAATLAGAVRAGLLAVDVNLGAIGDPETRRAFATERDRLLAAAAREGDAIVAAVRARLA